MISPFLRAHKLGIHLGHLLGDQTILRRPFPVAVEFESYWLEPIQRFAGLVHWLNVVFVSPGRVEDPHIVKLIDIYCCLAAGVADCLTEDAADEASIIEVSKRACRLDADCDFVDWRARCQFRHCDRERRCHYRR